MPIPASKPITRLFTDFLDKPIAAKLQTLGIEKATSIQYQTFMEVKDNSNVCLLSETGSGKTLAFLLPLLAKEPSLSPEIMIIVPNHELALQIQTVVKSVSDLDVCLLTPGDREGFDMIVKELSIENHFRMKRRDFVQLAGLGLGGLAGRA